MCCEWGYYHFCSLRQNCIFDIIFKENEFNRCKSSNFEVAVA